MNYYSGRYLQKHGKSRMDTEKTVFLVCTERSLLDDLLDHTDTRKQIPWMYLGRDLLFSDWLDRKVSSLGPRIPVDDDLRRIPLEERQSYIDYIGELSPSNTSLFWWMTALSERSPFSSDVLLYFCYISICTRYVKDHGDDLIVFGESRALLRSIGKNLETMEGVHVVFIDSPLLSRKESLLFFGASIVKLGYFTVTSTCRILLAGLYALARPLPRNGRRAGKETIVLYSWADRRSFPKPGSYTDAYLGEMDQAISRSDHDIIRLVQVIPTFFYLKAIWHLSAMKDGIHLSEEFLSLLDPLRAIVMVLSRYPRLEKPPFWAGLDVSDIVLWEHRRNRWGISPEKSCLAYLTARRMGSRLQPRAIIYPFENHSWEKLFCAGLREASPETLLMGYAHATIPPLELSYSRSRKYEAPGMPLPNLILVNGERSQQLLIKSGFDPEQVVVVGAFRYPYINTYQDSSREKSGSLILITTSVLIQESVEMLSKCIKAFRHLEGVEILIKCHPTLPCRHLSPGLPEPLPRNMKISMDPTIEPLLDKAGVLIYAGTSTVAVEALARGVPYIHVRSDLALDMDIFAGDNELEKSVSGPSELRDYTIRALQNPGEGLPDPQRAREFFEPVRMNIIEEYIVRRP
jgi:hypothetical protein